MQPLLVNALSTCLYCLTVNPVLSMPNNRPSDTRKQIRVLFIFLSKVIYDTFFKVQFTNYRDWDWIAKSSQPFCSTAFALCPRSPNGRKTDRRNRTARKASPFAWNGRTDRFAIQCEAFRTRRTCRLTSCDTLENKYIYTSSNENEKSVRKRCVYKMFRRNIIESKATIYILNTKSFEKAYIRTFISVIGILDFRTHDRFLTKKYQFVFVTSTLILGNLSFSRHSP